MRSSRTIWADLTRSTQEHVRPFTNSGRLVRVRRGLYAAVPLGQAPETVQPDPFLLASRMTSDSALAYHTALETTEGQLVPEDSSHSRAPRNMVDENREITEKSPWIELPA